VEESHGGLYPVLFCAGMPSLGNQLLRRPIPTPARVVASCQLTSPSPIPPPHKHHHQRVTAVFQYLDIENLGFFSLTDMNDKGAEVFDYLSISLDHTSFGFMDTFRKIDVDGSGEIDEDEFAVGIIELLRYVTPEWEMVMGR